MEHAINNANSDGATMMSDFTEYGVLTAKEAAQLLRVHANTVFLMCKRGELPHFKVGSHYRFSREALMRYIAGAERMPNIEGTTCQVTASLNDQTAPIGGRPGPTNAACRLAARLKLKK